MDMSYRAERAIGANDGAVKWVVVDGEYGLHAEGSAFIEHLRGLDRSTNTEKAYAGRTALYLNFCESHGLDWRRPGYAGFGSFRRWLVEAPLPPRGRKVRAVPRYRSPGSADAVLTTMGEFLRFAATREWVTPDVVAMLFEVKHVRFAPAAMPRDESGRTRPVRTRTFRFSVAEPGYEMLTDEQIEKMAALATRARDRFLVLLLAGTGMRIGEALGLRREDMHLLPSSHALGCDLAGAHVHVRRRRNSNGALAKSRFPRSIPVTGELVGFYTDYVHEREAVTEAAGSDMVFVNLFRGPLGKPMGYPNAKDLFDRLARKASFAARPHMLRHSAATRWVRSDTPRDVVQQLLGHVSPSSMDRYTHATDADKRDAVERVARGRREAL